MTKKGVFILLFICTAYLSNAQISVLNGSFENFTFTDCYDAIDVSDELYFNSNLQHFASIIYYNGVVPSWLQEFDLFSDTCTYSSPLNTITPPNGISYIGLVSSDTSGFSGKLDAFSLELSDSLIIGNWYSISYYHHKGGNSHTTSFPSHRPSRTEIGVSLIYNEFGDSLFTSSYTTNSWTKEEFIFQAITPSKHITVKPIKEAGRRYQLVDNFEIREVEAPPPSSISEYNSEPKLLRVVDMLGRESKPQPNTPLFYIYGDGTVEKKVIIE